MLTTSLVSANTTKILRVTVGHLYGQQNPLPITATDSSEAVLHDWRSQ